MQNPSHSQNSPNPNTSFSIHTHTYIHTCSHLRVSNLVSWGRALESAFKWSYQIIKLLLTRCISPAYQKPLLRAIYVSKWKRKKPASKPFRVFPNSCLAGPLGDWFRADSSLTQKVRYQGRAVYIPIRNEISDYIFLFCEMEIFSLFFSLISPVFPSGFCTD